MTNWDSELSGLYGDAELSSMLGDAQFPGDVNPNPPPPPTTAVMLQLGDVTVALDDPDNGRVVQSVDIGSPVAREVAYDLPGWDGTVDRTARAGGRNVVLNMTLLGDRQAHLDALAPFLHVSSRFTLLVATEGSSGFRALTVRPDPGGFEATWERPGMLEGTLGFRSVGSPYFTAVTPRDAAASPTDELPGVSFDIEWDMAFPEAGSIRGPAVVFNRGTAPAHWTCRIFGPITGPRLIHNATGRQITFKPTLVIQPGDFLRLNTLDRSVTLNGSEAAGRYSHLDFAATTPGWFLMEPGENRVRLSGAVFAGPTQAQFTWRDTYL